jgi:hypothetical protein
LNLQDLNRLRQITTIAARHGFADLLDRAGVFRLIGRRDPVEQAPETRAASTARRFRRMLEELGPTFVKLGQVLSTRADLLPGEFVTELRLLQDSVTPIPLDAVRAQIQAGLGRSPEEAFASIEPQPLAAASIAQVHRATTLEGDPVVVKVQRPGIQAQISSDLHVLRALAKLLEAVVEETGIYSPVGIVEEFDRAIREELDFVHEAENVHAFEETHRQRKGIRIPRVLDELSSGTVLTLEYFGGTKLLEAQLAPERRTELAHVVLDTAFRQLFVDGLFHADPHPGKLSSASGRRHRPRRLRAGGPAHAPDARAAGDPDRRGGAEGLRFGGPAAVPDRCARRAGQHRRLPQRHRRSAGQAPAAHAGRGGRAASPERSPRPGGEVPHPGSARVRPAVACVDLDGGESSGSSHPTSTSWASRCRTRRSCSRDATSWGTSRAACSVPCSASRGWPPICRRRSRRSSSTSRPGASACT